MGRSAKATTDPWIVGKGEAAEFFGLSTQALDHWFRTGCPVLSRSEAGHIESLDLRELARWRIGRSEQGSESEREKTRLTRAQADAAELRLAEERAALIRVPLVVKAWHSYVLACRAKLLALPTRLAPLVAAEADTDACREILEREVAAALTELAHDGLPGDVERDLAEGFSSVGTAPEAELEPVG